MSMKLRPYQKEAIKAIESEWAQGHKTLAVLGTGLGKTIIFSNIAKNCAEKGDRVLILAHRGELLTQAAEKLKLATGVESALEKAEKTCLGSEENVVVGSVQSLAQEQRLAKFPEDYFQEIIIDEAHHCVSETYQRVLSHFPGAKVLGVTATPDRGDMKSLGRYFDSLAYEYSMKDGIQNGYLVPIKAQMIPLELDISNVKINSGDYAVGEVDAALKPYLERIAMLMREYCANRKTLVFLPLIKTSQYFCELLNDAGFSAAEVHGTSSDRDEIIRDFEAGKYNVICNSMLLTEGFDCPAVDCIINLRPTRSRSLFVQILGRGTRLSEGKEDLLVLDFLWQTGTHNLCKPASLFCDSEEVEGRIQKKLKDTGGIFDLLELESEVRADIQAEREAALAEKLAAMKKRRAKLVDPMQYFFSIEDGDFFEYEPTFAWEEDEPTEKQLAYIEKCGLSTEGIETKGMATKVINRLFIRQKNKYTTPKQIKLLERYGFKHVGKWKSSEAKVLIDAIAANNWRVPTMIRPEAYTPS